MKSGHDRQRSLGVLCRQIDEWKAFYPVGIFSHMVGKFSLTPGDYGPEKDSGFLKYLAKLLKRTHFPESFYMPEFWYSFCFYLAGGFWFVTVLLKVVDVP